jgi:ribose transport system substrate-binding protein
MKLSLLTALAALAAAPLAAAEAYKIAVIPKGTTHEFWNAIHAGARKAERELKAEGVNLQVIWKGPLREDDREQQIQVVENFVAQRVSGIVLAPLDRKGLVAPVETAVRGKIPVIIIDMLDNFYFEIIDYSSFAIFMEERDIEDIEARLMSFKHEELKFQI